MGRSKDTTPHEAALDYAVRFFKRTSVREMLTVEGGRRHRRKERDHLFFTTFMRTDAPGCTLLDETFIEARNGSREANEDLCRLAASLVEAGTPLGEPLRSYVVEELRQPRTQRKKQGPDRNSLAKRDYVIAAAVLEVAEKYQIRPTRSREIVTKALRQIGVHMTERTIKRIWDDRRARSFSGSFGWVNRAELARYRR